MTTADLLIEFTALKREYFSFSAVHPRRKSLLSVRNCHFGVMKPLMLPSPSVPCSQTPPGSPAASPLSAAYCRLPGLRPGRPPDLSPHEAQSLHLRYSPEVALSTLSSCRYLHEPKTRFPVGRLFPFPGRGFHPLEAPGLSWRTVKGTKTEGTPHRILMKTPSEITWMCHPLG